MGAAPGSRNPRDGALVPVPSPAVYGNVSFQLLIFPTSCAA
jgi:hypothetical protein